MNEFKSNIFLSIISKGIRNAMLLSLLYLTGSFIDYSALIPFQLGLWGVAMIYVFSFVVQIFLTNNDLKIEEKEIIIQSILFKGLRNKRFKKDEIEEIVFKDEWDEAFMSKNPTSTTRLVILNFVLIFFIPWEYKWIKIKTKNNRQFKYYFFGIDYESYEDSKEIFFEDMFLELAKRNIKVKWNSTEDTYFKYLQEKADEILLNLNVK